MGVELKPSDLRWLANNGDSDWVEPKKLCAGSECAETPYPRARLQDMSRAADNIEIPDREITRRRENRFRAGMSRRMAMRSMLGGLVAAGVLSDNKAKALMGTVGGQHVDGKLYTNPPILTSPTTVMMTTGPTQYSVGSAGDYIGIAPAVPIVGDGNFYTGVVTFNGLGLGNNLLIVGAEVNASAVYNPTTMVLNNNSGYAAVSQSGFSGATGGTFTISCSLGWPTLTTPADPVTTAAIAWNATDAQVLTAIETAYTAVFGAQTQPPILAVINQTSPNNPGGPWQFVPYNNGALGHCTVSITGLTGSPVSTGNSSEFNAGPNSFYIPNWAGTVHFEGLWGHGPNASDCMGYGGIASSTSCIMHNVNNHYECGYAILQDVWIHGDALQTGLGPVTHYSENCDYVTYASNGSILQPLEAGNPGLTDWLYWGDRGNQFRNYYRDNDPYVPNGGSQTGLFINTEYGTTGNQAGWQLIFAGAGGFVNVFSTTNPATQITNLALDKYVAWEWTPRGGVEAFYTPQGLTVNGVPSTPNGLCADPTLGQCGATYVTPGYLNPAGTALPPMIQRVTAGATKICAGPGCI